MAKPNKYVGIDKEMNGGMTSIGKIILDAWVFDLLPETETCEGWDISRLNVISEKVNTEWDKYGCMVSQLPKDLFDRHQRIYNAAIERAKSSGWSGESEIDDELK